MGEYQTFLAAGIKIAKEAGEVVRAGMWGMRVHGWQNKTSNT